LLKTLTGSVRQLGGSFSFGPNVEWGYFDQQAAVADFMNPEQTVLENFWEEYPRLQREQVRSALGSFLFSGEDVEKKMGQLSGGERVRLALCKMFQTRPNLLILDEPTNHMDIVGKEALEQMLRAFTGTVLFVSHDRYFLDRVTRKTFAFLGQGEIKAYNGSYSDYEARRQEEQAQEKRRAKSAQSSKGVRRNDVASSGDDHLSSKTKSERPRFTYKEQKEFETIEEDIAALEAQL